MSNLVRLIYRRGNRLAATQAHFLLSGAGNPSTLETTAASPVLALRLALPIKKLNISL